MLDSSGSFLSGLALTTIGSAGLCFFAYDALRIRNRLHRRVDLLPPLRPHAATPSSVPFENGQARKATGRAVA